MMMKKTLNYGTLKWTIGPKVFLSILPLCLYIYLIQLEPVGSQVIGSSVVTSVSVVLGHENEELTPSSSTTPSPSSPSSLYHDRAPIVPSTPKLISPTSRPPSPLPPSSDPSGVLSVIATLKNIVEQENQKHHGLGNSTGINDRLGPSSEAIKDSKGHKKRPGGHLTYTSPSTRPNHIVQSADESPPPTSTAHFPTTEDDEEEEGALATASEAQTTTVDFFPTTIISGGDGQGSSGGHPLEDNSEEEEESSHFTPPRGSNNGNNGKNGTTTSVPTGTSAEVNAAIHQISGVLFPMNVTKKPLETIITDVFSSINKEQKEKQKGSVVGSKGSTTHIPLTSSTTTTSGSSSGKQKSPGQGQGPKVTPKGQSSTTTPRVPSTTRAPPTTTATPSSSQGQSKSPSTQYRVPPHGNNSGSKKGSSEGSQGQGNSKPHKTHGKDRDKDKDNGRPSHGNNARPPPPHNNNEDDNLTQEEETEEVFNFQRDDLYMTTLRPRPRPSSSAAGKPSQGQGKPTRAPIIYLNSSNKYGATGSSTARPSEFYDDEIFGYDPYQTFFHGIYVPEIPTEIPYDGATAGQSTESPEFEAQGQGYINHAGLRPAASIPAGTGPSKTPPKNYPTLKNVTPVRPVLSLPDHLHRPRPSHLQYQHTAMDIVDSETGLLAIKVPRPDPPSPGASSPGTQATNSPGALGSLRPLAESSSVPSSSPNSKPRPSPTTPTQSNLNNNVTQYHGLGDEAQLGSLNNLQNDAVVGIDTETRPNFSKAPPGNPGLETTVTNLDPETRVFVDINNRLGLRLFSSLTNPVSKSSADYGNMILSPFTIITSLAMLFLGARGSTAAQLDGLLQLDDMLSFNPHLLYYNITQSFLSQPNTASAIIRLLIADKNKGDVLDFFKTRVQHFYDTRVEEADYKFAGHLAQSIINQMIRAQIQRHSYEMLSVSLPLKGPMSMLTSTFYDAQFGGIRDPTVKEMYFIHSGSLGRRLVQVPAIAFRGSMRAAYDNDLDATAVEIPYTSRELSLILVMPGKPGESAIGGVSSLKSRLTLDSWSSLIRGFYPRESFKIIFPRFRHHSSLNLTYTLKRFGLTEMFLPYMAKFKGINGLADLYLDQNIMHFAEFGTLEKLSDTLTESIMEGTHKKFDLVRILRPHVREHYGNYGEPMSVNDWIFMSRHSPSPHPRETMAHQNRQGQGHPGSSAGPTPVVSYPKVRSSRGRLPISILEEGSNYSPTYPNLLDPVDSPRTPRSKVYYFRQEGGGGGDNGGPDEKVLRFERPFLYVLRHNPTGMILMTGQYTEPVTRTD